MIHMTSACNFHNSNLSNCLHALFFDILAIASIIASIISWLRSEMSFDAKTYSVDKIIICSTCEKEKENCVFSIKIIYFE